MSVHSCTTHTWHVYHVFPESQQVPVPNVTVFPDYGPVQLMVPVPSIPPVGIKAVVIPKADEHISNWNNPDIKVQTLEGPAVAAYWTDKTPIVAVDQSIKVNFKGKFGAVQRGGPMP